MRKKKPIGDEIGIDEENSKYVRERTENFLNP